MNWGVERMHYVWYQSVKAHQVAKEMKRLGLAILGVSKTRWTGAGKVQLASGKNICVPNPNRHCTPVVLPTARRHFEIRDGNCYNTNLDIDLIFNDGGIRWRLLAVLLLLSL